MAMSLILSAYAAGLASAPYFEFARPLAVLPWLAAATWFVLRHQRSGILPLTVFFWSLGLVFYNQAVSPPRSPDHIIAFLSDQPVILEATIITVTSRPLERTLIDLAVYRVGDNGILAPARGKIRLYLDEPAPGLLPGDAVRFRSRLRTPQTFGTPGEYDYPRHLARQGIFATASLKNAREIATLRKYPVRSPRFSLEGWRRQLALSIDENLPEGSAALVKAMVIGDKGGVASQQRDLLARGGVSHIFAISGLHLGLIALFLYSAALTLYRRSETLLLYAPPKRLLPLIILPMLLAYLLLTGNALPTRRAFLMSLAGGLLIIGARRMRPVRLLATVAFVLLLFDPLALFEPSFQLSFAGILGILALLSRWQTRLPALPKPIRWLLLLFLTTLAATIATTPAVLFHFHMFAPAGLLTNLFAVPAIGCFALPLGLTGGFLLPLWGDGGAFLLQGCGFIIETVLLLVQWIVDLPLLGGWKIYLSPVQTGGVILLCTIPFVSSGAMPAWSGRSVLLIAGILMLCWKPPAPAQLTVTALSVGQGDAFLISLADGRNYLVDGGGMHSRTFDVGERLLAPALAQMGIRSLDAILLTHDQADHRQGLPYLLNQFPVGAFWCSEDPDKLDASLRATLQQRDVPASRYQSGWKILEASDKSTLALFVPDVETDNPNDRSLVLYMRHGEDGLLLTGDLEEEGVIALLQHPPPGPVNLLKLPHHGSRRSSPELLLEQLRPQLTFVSAGAGNAFRFPHAEVVGDLERRGIPLYRTDQMGSIRFLSDGTGWRIQQWERGLFR